MATLYKELKDAGHPEAIPRRPASEDFHDPVDVGEAGAETPLSWLQRLNETHWAVTDGGQFRVYHREDPTPAHPHGSWVRQTRTDFESFYCNRTVETPSGKTLPLGEAWIKWPGRRSASSVVFEPERQAPHGALNLWRGLAVEPLKGNWSMMRELIRDVLCCGDDERDSYLMLWLASCVQRPGSPGEVAVSLRGRKGTGKSTLGRYMKEIFGAHGLHISNPRHLTGNFNAHLRDCVFLFADEAFWAGDKAGEQVLKQLITEREILFEAKGQNAVMGPNFIHLLTASNSDWVVPAGLDGERRFFVSDVSDRRQGDRAFFSALNAQMDGGGLAAMLHDLLAMDISGRHVRYDVPATAALTEQKVLTMDPVQGWWLECLHDGRIKGELTPWAKGPTHVMTQDLQASLTAHLELAGQRRSRRSVGTTLGLELSKLAPRCRRIKVTPPDGRLDVETQHDGRANAYELPPLAECRAHFAGKLLGNPSYRWEDERDPLD